MDKVNLRYSTLIASEGACVRFAEHEYFLGDGCASNGATSQTNSPLTSHRFRKLALRKQIAVIEQ
jgi:hypothetical protein